MANLGKFLFPQNLVALKRRVDVPRKQLGRALPAARFSSLFRRTMTQRYLLSVATSSLALGFAGCAASDDATTTDEPVAATQQAATAIGDPLPGTDLTEFAAAKANFAQEEEIGDGLGPVF